MMEKMLRLVETTLSNDKFNILHTVFSFITFMKSRIWLMKVVFSLNFDMSLCFRTSYLNCKIRFPRPDSQIIQVWMKNIYTFQTQSGFKYKFRVFVLNKTKERDLILFFLFVLLPGKLVFKNAKTGLYPAEESRYVQCQYWNHGDFTHKVVCSHLFKIPTPLNLKGLEFSSFSFQNSE